MKKFDLVISNPPFNNGVDISILKTVFDIQKEIIFVHPSTWQVENKGNKEYQFKNNKHLVDIQLFWQNKLFNIDAFVPLCISHWDMTKEYDTIKIIDEKFEKDTYIIDNVEKISFFGKKYDDVKEIVDMFLSMDSIYNHRVKKEDWNNVSNNVVCYQKVRGDVPRSYFKTNETEFNKDFFTLISNDPQKISKRMTRQQFLHDVPQGDNDSMGWDFGANNPTYPQNFVEFCKSFTQRFLLSWFKINGNNHRGEIKAIPWLDWSKTWTDQMLFDEYIIPVMGKEKAKELWDFIVSFIPQYYDDYKSGM